MSKAYIPLPSPGASGVQPDGTATATCLCGAVQLSFPVEGKELVNTFVCNCTDCRKLSSSMFCSNFTVTDKSLKHLRGEEKLSRHAQNRTIATGATMEDSFCSICGNLMYRRSSRFPGLTILRIGTVDDFNLHESKLKPQFEQFIKDRVSWFDGVQTEDVSRHLASQHPIDEETLPYYEPEQFYPVNIGDVYHDRYQVTGKLGYGAYSTNWLCKDLRDNKHRVLKVSTSLSKYPTATNRETKIYEHLANVKSSHPGQSLIRELHDSFDLKGPVGEHQCLVLQPMHMTLLEMMRLNPKPFDLPLLKLTLKRLLLALDFLHTEAEIIHTDLKTDNLMLSLEDSTMLADFAKAEVDNPSPRKTIDQTRTIYQSRQFRRPTKGKHYGLPVLCDFGEAHIGKRQESGPFVQPSVYRAPEIIFEMPWGSAVDIWNLACLIWDLFEGEHLFGDIFGSKGGHDPFKHLALMVALIGPPPNEFLRRSAWIAQKEAVIPSVSLEHREKRLSGQEKKLFIEFIRSMLRWLPEERKTAKQLLEDPWLL